MPSNAWGEYIFTDYEGTEIHEGDICMVWMNDEDGNNFEAKVVDLQGDADCEDGRWFDCSQIFLRELTIEDDDDEYDNIVVGPDGNSDACYIVKYVGSEAVEA